MPMKKSHEQTYYDSASGDRGDPNAPDAPAKSKRKKTKFGGLWKETGKGDNADVQHNAGLVLNKPTKAGQSYRQMLTYLINNAESAGLADDDTDALKSKLVEADAAALPTYVRFRDLVDACIVGNWPTLSRLIDEQNFPAGVMLGKNTRAWRLDEVQAWLAALPTARKIVPRQASEGQPHA
jgi:predicted DNA-binding transcriptional regulator AlpA